MSIYLKALGIYIYFATIKDSYCLNSKHLEANAKDVHTLKSTLIDDYLFRVANFDSVFIVWNTLSSLDEQMSYDKERDSDEGNDTSNICYMVQRDDPLEVKS